MIIDKKQKKQVRSRNRQQLKSNSGQLQQSQYRPTLPFVQFESVKQYFRVTIPQKNSQNTQSIVNIKNMQEINRNRNINKQASQSKYEEVKNKHERSSTFDVKPYNKTKKMKNKKQNNSTNGKFVKQLLSDKYKSTRYKFNSQFTIKYQPSKIKKYYKNKPSHKLNCKQQPTQQLKKSNKSNQKSKHFHFNKITNLSLQNLNLKQIYNIHKSRQYNSQSHNTDRQRKKQNTHKRRLSYELNTLRQCKTARKQKHIDEKLKKALTCFLRHKNSPIIQKMCTSSQSSLDSFDYHISAKKQLQDQIWNSKKNSDYQAFISLQMQPMIDSDDDHLMAMISQDTQSMRSMVQTQCCNNDSVDISQIPDFNNQKQFIDLSVFKFKKKQQKIQQKNAILSNTNHCQIQEKNMKNTIDHKNVFIVDTQILKQHSSKSLKKSDGYQRGLNQISQDNSFLNRSKWQEQPTIQQLQQILDHCLNEKLEDQPINQQQHQFQLNEIQQIFNNNYDNNDNNINNNVNVNSNDQNTVEKKWKQNEINNIKKVKKLLTSGLIQAQKILKNSTNIKQIQKKSINNTNKNKAKNKNKKNTHLLNQKCKSMQNISCQLTNANNQSNPKPIYPIVLKQQQDIHQDQSSQSSDLVESVLDDDLVVVDENSSDSDRLSFNDSYNDYTKHLDRQMTNQKDVNNEQISQQKPKIKAPQNTFTQSIKRFTTKQIDEIIQFIFIDFFLQFIQQIGIYFDEPPNVLQKMLNCTKSIQQPSNVNIGFVTGPKQIYSILQNFMNFIQDTIDIQFGNTCKEVVYMRVSKPIGPNPLELLKYMREEDDPFIHLQWQEERMEENQDNFVFSLDWFHQFSKKQINRYQLGTYFPNDEDREARRRAFVQSAMYIHIKAIFDSLNQTIDKYRPYGVVGQPFPWKLHMPPQLLSLPQFHNILRKTFEEVAQNTRYLCGIFPQQHFSHKLNNDQHKELVQDRFLKMLCKEVQDNQSQWLAISDQETQVLMIISKYIAKILILQLIQEISGFNYFRGEIKVL